MKKKVLVIATLAIAMLALARLFVVWRAGPAPSAGTELRLINGINVDYVLTPSRVASIEFQLGRDFDVTSSGNVIISSSGGLLELESDAHSLTVDKIVDGLASPDSFALDAGATVLAITDQFFGQLDGNQYSKAVPLPSRGMRLGRSVNPGTVYLFGGEGAVANRLYAFHRDGQLTIIADLAKTISAVADTEHAIYVATSSEIFRVRQNSIELIIRLPDNTGPVISIAASPDDKVLYFSSAKRLYGLRGLAAISIINDAGGALLMQQGYLYLWARERNLLVRLANPEETLLATKE